MVRMTLKLLIWGLHDGPWYHPKREYVARPHASSMRGRGGGRGRGGHANSSQEYQDMEEDNPKNRTSSGRGDMSWLRKRDMGTREGQLQGNILAITSRSHVVDVVGALEGKAVGETAPEKNQVPKRHKVIDPPIPLAASSEEGRRDQ
jgi:hypothetical protein